MFERQNQHLEQVTYIQKTIRLQNEAHPAHFDTIKVMFNYNTSNRTLSFNTVLHSLCKQGFPLEGSQFFFWDNIKTMFVYMGCFPSQTSMDIPYEFFQQKLIHLRYRKIMRKMEPIKERQRQTATKRVKERTIKQAFEKVSIWQKLYDQTDSNGKKLYTLQAAAREIGVAKKTLDDYKNQIKLGEKYNFDFGKNRFQKIGVLRAFIKQAINLKIQPSQSSQQRPISPPYVSSDQPVKMQAFADPSVHSGGSDDQNCENAGYLFHQTHSWCDSD